MLYSQDLELFTGDLNQSIECAIEDVKKELNIVDDLILYEFDKNRIAISVPLNINIPSKGTYDDIDIRKIEQVLIVFDKDNYPTRSPVIKSDRKDLPTEKLSHLYVVRSNESPTLCLIRGSLDEWFSNRRINDLITVARQWFSKASSGHLITDGDEFDPIRLQGYSGYLIYKYSSFYDIISKDFSFLPNQSFSIILLATSKDNAYTSEDDLSYQYITYVPFLKSEEIIKQIKGENIDDPKNKAQYKLLFGLLFWSENVCHVYDVNFPKTYGELVGFCRNHGIEINESINLYRTNDFKLFYGIPIVIAVKRPSKLIEYPAEYEFFHFVIHASPDNIKNNKIINSSRVRLLSHREPLSSQLAQKISGSNNNDKTLFIGSGALGSKIIMHFARGGNFNLVIIDNDKLSPHNLVRHELFMESSGFYKSEEIAKKIKDFLIIDNKKTIKAITKNLFNVNQNDFDGYEWLVDTTASLNVQNWLSNNNFLNIKNRSRAEIAYKGNLGLLYIEGRDHNPRIDDLVNYTYFLASEIEELSEWLKNEQLKKEGEDYDIVDVGLGCNSATVKMSNDSISFHASIFTKILKTENNRQSIKDNGLINISFLSDNGFDLFSSSFVIPSFDIFKCENQSGWEIRIDPNVLKVLAREEKKYGSDETGGIFIGISNYKTKTIHVFDTILAPSDSKRSSTYFYRGINDLPEQVDHIKKITGDMIGYIGEWHTHPMGLNMLSQTDLKAVDDLKPLNNKIPIPTFISILSKKKFLPFVFD